MSGMVADTIEVPDQLGDAARGPDLPDEAVVVSSLREAFREFSLLLLAQPRLRTEGEMAAKSFLPALSGSLQPLAHRSAGNSHGFGNVFLFPASALEFQGTEPPNLPPVPRLAGARGLHTLYGICSPFGSEIHVQVYGTQDSAGYSCCQTAVGISRAGTFL